MNEEMWEGRLHVAGHGGKLVTALAELKKNCGLQPKGRYRQAVDQLQHPQLAEGNQVPAIPTLVCNMPEPIRNVTGGLPSQERVVVGFGLRALHHS